MRLDYTLVSSFLFVSAVLAAIPALPCFPTYLKNSGATDTYWAGVMWCTDDEKETVDYASAVFTLPSPVGNVGEGFDITIGISGQKFPYAGFQASIGITVFIDNTGEPQYIPWARWYKESLAKPSYLDNFELSKGDLIRASIRIVARNTARVWLTNLSRGGVQWVSVVIGSVILEEHRDAEWLITKLAWGTQLPLPDFYQLVFDDIRIRIRTAGSNLAYIAPPPKLSSFMIREKGIWKTDIVRNRNGGSAVIIYDPVIGWRA